MGKMLLKGGARRSGVWVPSAGPPLYLTLATPPIHTISPIHSHTFYFSCVLLGLFSDMKNDAVKEQITRVLLERLIVNRPHPWVRGCEGGSGEGKEEDREGKREGEEGAPLLPSPVHQCIDPQTLNPQTRPAPKPLTLPYPPAPPSPRVCSSPSSSSSRTLASASGPMTSRAAHPTSSGCSRTLRAAAPGGAAAAAAARALLEAALEGRCCSSNREVAVRELLAVREGMAAAAAAFSPGVVAF